MPADCVDFGFRIDQLDALGATHDQYPQSGHVELFCWRTLYSERHTLQERLVTSEWVY